VSVFVVRLEIISDTKQTTRETKKPPYDYSTQYYANNFPRFYVLLLGYKPRLTIFQNQTFSTGLRQSLQCPVGMRQNTPNHAVQDLLVACQSLFLILQP